MKYFVIIVLIKVYFGNVCMKEFMSNFGVKGLARPSRTKKNYICSSILDNCCDYLDQLLLYNNFINLKEDTDKKLGSDLKQINAVSTIITNLKRSNYHLYNRLLNTVKSEICRYDFILKHFAKAIFNKDLNNTNEFNSYKSQCNFSVDNIFYYLNNNLKPYKEYIMTERQKFLCFICDYDNRNGIDVSNSTVNIRKDYCINILDNTVYMVFIKFNILYKVLLDLISIYQNSYSQIYETDNFKYNFLNNKLKIIEGCINFKQKNKIYEGECLELCKLFRFEKENVVFDNITIIINDIKVIVENISNNRRITNNNSSQNNTNRNRFIDNKSGEKHVTLSHYNKNILTNHIRANYYYLNNYNKINVSGISRTLLCQIYNIHICYKLQLYVSCKQVAHNKCFKLKYYLYYDYVLPSENILEKYFSNNQYDQFLTIKNNIYSLNFENLESSFSIVKASYSINNNGIYFANKYPKLNYKEEIYVKLNKMRQFQVDYYDKQRVKLNIIENNIKSQIESISKQSVVKFNRLSYINFEKISFKTDKNNKILDKLYATYSYLNDNNRLTQP